MKNLRKDTYLGIILLALWLVIRIFFNGSGFFMWLLGIVGLVILVVSLLPEKQRKQVHDYKDKVVEKFKK